MPELHLAQHAEADRLLSEDPLALLIGMVLDQQIPLEKAFRSPLDLKERLGRDLDAADIAAMDPDRLAKLFATPPALHRFPGSMAGRVQELCRVVSEEYGNDSAAVWSTARTGEELLKRIKKLPGFGEQKAKIFTALLGKQLGVKPKGWAQAAGTFGEKGSLRSVADITGPDTLNRVRAFKKEMKAKAKAAAAEPVG
ncbi:MAG TPA: HhH-GPD-type base excision DNA repair protein [Acidimicrobiales bacterium]|nr:HhH-GPD-type base excision DNA repair protein [Acidimicrobiales bacterium]